MTITTNNEDDKTNEGATMASDDRTNEATATRTLASDDKTPQASNVAVPVGTSDPVDQPYVANNPADKASQTSGKAVASMVCGIIGIFIFGIILGPVAICLANSAKKDIQESNGRVQGECQAQTGLICGIVAIVIWFIVVIAFASS